MTPAYVLLKTELIAWLNVRISPQKDREKKSEQMQTLIDAQQKRLISLGVSTVSSVSDASTGRQENSGPPTSGT